MVHILVERRFKLGDGLREVEEMKQILEGWTEMWLDQPRLLTDCT